MRPEGYYCVAVDGGRLEADENDPGGDVLLLAWYPSATWYEEGPKTSIWVPKEAFDLLVEQYLEEKVKRQAEAKMPTKPEKMPQQKSAVRF